MGMTAAPHPTTPPFHGTPSFCPTPTKCLCLCFAFDSLVYLFSSYYLCGYEKEGGASVPSGLTTSLYGTGTGGGTFLPDATCGLPFILRGVPVGLAGSRRVRAAMETFHHAALPMGLYPLLLSHYPTIHSACKTYLVSTTTHSPTAPTSPLSCASPFSLPPFSPPPRASSPLLVLTSPSVVQRLLSSLSSLSCHAYYLSLSH